MRQGKNFNFSLFFKRVLHCYKFAYSGRWIFFVLFFADVVSVKITFRWCLLHSSIANSFKVKFMLVFLFLCGCFFFVFFLFFVLCLFIFLLPVGFSMVECPFSHFCGCPTHQSVWDSHTGQTKFEKMGSEPRLPELLQKHCLFNSFYILTFCWLNFTICC